MVQFLSDECCVFANLNIGESFIDLAMLEMFGEFEPRNCFSTYEPIAVINLCHIINIVLVFKNDISVYKSL